MSHTAQSIYRVVGQLTPGFLKVELVRDGEPSSEGFVSIRDSWLDQVPLELVALSDRLPNTLLRVTVQNRYEVVHVERQPAA